jgi:hypothetical protein
MICHSHVVTPLIRHTSPGLNDLKKKQVHGVIILMKQHNIYCYVLSCTMNDVGAHSPSHKTLYCTHLCDNDTWCEI